MAGFAAVEAFLRVVDGGVSHWEVRALRSPMPRFLRAATLALVLLVSALAIADPGGQRFSRVLVDRQPPQQGDAQWGRNPIDAFVLERLRRAGIRPQGEADRYSLIRRLTAGLTGLPPTPEQIAKFVDDPDSQAYEKLVDRLLASPRFGERWAPHWLDVARFGESDGILTVNEDKIRDSAWRYRDAVIRAFNDDLPFDRFVRYQLAGVPDGTGPYRELRQFPHLGTRLQNNADPNDKQFHRLDDMVSTTGNALLGFTFGCARCHDHPVDPMTTEEYYQFTAVFWNQVRVEPKASAKRIPLEIAAPRILKGGSWSAPGDPVEPGFLRVLMAKGAPGWGRDGKRDLEALGDWLTDVEHGAGGQLARVIVNRLWHHHFGRGLVGTPNDFGALGEAPSHPELLEWLASRLIEGGWELKPIHRLLVSSATYRQAGASDAAPLGRDADNVLLWQRRPQRLEAEVIRDRYLSVAGVLREQMYGKSVSIGAYKNRVEDTPDKWRRSIYLQAHRTVTHPTLGLFDPPDRERSLGSRNTGASVESALFALNAPLLWELAEHFAERVRREAGEGSEEQIGQAYFLALSRPPRGEELRVGLQFLAGRGEAGLVEYCHLLFALNEFIYVQ